IPYRNVYSIIMEVFEFLTGKTTHINIVLPSESTLREWDKQHVFDTVKDLQINIQNQILNIGYEESKRTGRELLGVLLSFWNFKTDKPVKIFAKLTKISKCTGKEISIGIENVLEEMGVKKTQLNAATSYGAATNLGCNN